MGRCVGILHASGFLAAIIMAGCGGGGGVGSNAIITGAPPLTATTSGAQRFASGYSYPSVSDDGRYIAYSESLASAPSGMPANVAGTSNVFVLDRSSGNRQLVSVASSPQSAGNGNSFNPIISGNGRYVLFYSHATNLVSGVVSYPIDSSGQVFAQWYVRDIQASVTQMVSVDPSGASAADLGVNEASISPNGQFIVFVSPAKNLVLGVTYASSQNSWAYGQNVFLRDMSSHVTELISISPDGMSAGINGTVSVTGPSHDSNFPYVSDDGRYVAFQSFAWNLVNGVAYTPSPTDQVSNIFLRDRATGKTALLSISPDGTQASNGFCNIERWGSGRAMSSDGSLTTFSSGATNLTSSGQSGVFVRDRAAASPVLISVAFDGTVSNGSSITPVVSGDGRYVAYSSTATNLVMGGFNYWPLGTGPGGPQATNIYRWTRATNSTELISLSSDGTSGADFLTQFPALSTDGQVVSFSGSATNLTVSPAVPLTFTQTQDSVYRWDATTGKVQLATQINHSSLGNTAPTFAMSADGNVIAFDAESFGSYFMPF